MNNVNFEKNLSIFWSKLLKMPIFGKVCQKRQFGAKIIDFRSKLSIIGQNCRYWVKTFDNVGFASSLSKISIMWQNHQKCWFRVETVSNAGFGLVGSNPSVIIYLLSFSLFKQHHNHHQSVYDIFVIVTIFLSWIM